MTEQSKRGKAVSVMARAYRRVWYWFHVSGRVGGSMTDEQIRGLRTVLRKCGHR